MAKAESILFVSHKRAQCGVYEYGRAVATELAASRKFDFVFAECAGPDEYRAAVATHSPAAIVYNYHPSTLPWLKRGLIAEHDGPHVGLIHEITQEIADRFDRQLFEFAIAPDPTLLLRNPVVFKTGRLVLQYENRYPLPAVPRIGSFGFGTPGKGYDALVERVQRDFDSAVIALNIPFSTFADPDGAGAHAIADQCRRIVTKPGVTLEVDHKYLSSDEVLDFLARSSLNAFFYTVQGGRGISSVIDAALAVGRPIAVTDSSMFRHLRQVRPSIMVERERLTDILARGVAPFAPLVSEWTAENLVWDYERILSAILATRAGKGRSLIAKTVERVRATEAFQSTERVSARIGRKLKPVTHAALRRLETSTAGQALREVVRTRPELTAGLRAVRARVGQPEASGTGDWIPKAGDDNHLRISQRGEVERYHPVPRIDGLNRILSRAAFATYQPAIDYLFHHMPEVMARKIPEANIQQAFVFDTVVRLVAEIERPQLLGVGSYEDTAGLALILSGYRVDEIDPVLNYDLSTYMTKPSCKRGAYHAVFATSVIEHVVEDEPFLLDIEELLAPGGVGVLTCDFNDSYRLGDKLPVEDRRFYTQRDLGDRMLKVLRRCQLVDPPNWSCEAPDFSYGGCQYTFASFVFRKTR